MKREDFGQVVKALGHGEDAPPREFCSERGWTDERAGCGGGLGGGHGG